LKKRIVNNALITPKLFAKYPKYGKIISLKMVVSSGDKITKLLAKVN